MSTTASSAPRSMSKRSRSQRTDIDDDDYVPKRGRPRKKNAPHLTRNDETSAQQSVEPEEQASIRGRGVDDSGVLGEADPNERASSDSVQRSKSHATPAIEDTEDKETGTAEGEEDTQANEPQSHTSKTNVDLRSIVIGQTPSGRPLIAPPRTPINTLAHSINSFALRKTYAHIRAQEELIDAVETMISRMRS